MKRNTRSHKGSLKKRLLIILALAVSYIIYLAVSGQLSSILNSLKKDEATQTQYTIDAPEGTTLTVTYLDVGQGNCTIVESNGEYMLIDGGDRDTSSFVVSYLSRHNITNFKYIVITHYDADHLNGVIGVLNNYSVDNVISPDYKADTKLYNSYITCLKDKKIDPIHPEINDTFELGYADFEVVWPDSYKYESDNDNSVGIRLYDDSHSFLILGDAEADSEKLMLKNNSTLKSDVYLVSHHGSNSSSTQAFLNEVDPDYAVISVGKDNKYGHPSDKVIQRLTDMNVNIFRTDINGTITVFSTKDQLQFKLEKQ